MIVLFLTAALLADPALRQTTALKPAPSAVAPQRHVGTAYAPALHAVAVTLECTARASGRVENCQVLGETHPGLGFGDAAIALVQNDPVAPGRRDIQFARTIQFMP